MEPVVTVLLFVAVVFLLVFLWAAYQYINFTKWSILSVQTAGIAGNRCAENNLFHQRIEGKIICCPQCGEKDYMKSVSDKITK